MARPRFTLYKHIKIGGTWRYCRAVVAVNNTVVQFLFTTLTGLFFKKCNRLKARVVIYAYNHHVRLLSPGPAVVDKPQSTRAGEPTLLCNQVGLVQTCPHDLPGSRQKFDDNRDWMHAARYDSTKALICMSSYLPIALQVIG